MKNQNKKYTKNKEFNVDIKIDDILQFDCFKALKLLFDIKTTEKFLKLKHMKRLIVHLQNVRKADYYKIENFDLKIYNCVLKHTVSSEISYIFPILSHLKLNETQLYELKKLFSYNLVYQFFRSEIIKKDLNHLEIILAIKLLDSPELVLKNIYPFLRIISETSGTVKIDDEILSAISVINSVNNADSRIFSNKIDYILSLTVFLTNILNESKNYTNLHFKDIKILIKTVTSNIRIILTSKNTNILHNKNLFAGLYASAYTVVNKYNKVTTTLDEDIFCLYVNMRMMSMFYNICCNLNVNEFNYSKIIDNLLNIKYSKPVFMKKIMYMKILSSIYMCKYSILDKIVNFIEFKYDLTQILVHDFKTCFDYRKILKRIQNMRKYINICKLTDIKEMVSENANDVTKIKNYHHVQSDKLDNKKTANDDQIDIENDVNHELLNINIIDANKQKNRENEQSIVGNKIIKHENHSVQDEKDSNLLSDNIKYKQYDLKKDEFVQFQIDELNVIALIDFCLHSNFIDQFKKDDFLYEMQNILTGYSLQFYLLVTFKILKNIENLGSITTSIKLLAFLFICHLDNRNNKINLQKEKKIIKYVRKSPQKIKNIFFCHLFETLNKNKIFHFSACIIALCIGFHDKIDLTETEIFNYFLNVLMRNTQNNSKKFEYLYISTFCYICIKRNSLVKSQLQTFYKPLILLINCLKISFDHDYDNYLKTELLKVVFNANELEKKELQKIYLLLSSEISENKSEYVKKVNEFEENIQENLKF